MFKRSISVIYAACMVTAATAQAETVTVTQLTNNTIQDTNFWLNGVGDVAWTAYEVGDSEVYYYDADTQAVIAVTNNTIEDSNAVLNGSGDLIWLQSGPNPDPAVPSGTLYKIMHRRAADGVISEIASSDSGFWYPQINDNGDIVWLGYEPLAASADIFLYKAATGTTTNITANVAGGGNFPKLNERGDVVFIGDDGSYGIDIFMYTASTDAVTNISSPGVTGESAWYLAINNSGDAVWSSNDGIESHIFRYDGATGTTQQLTVDNGAYDSLQWLSGNGDVAWNSNNNIMLYNASTQTVTQLTTDSLYRSNPVIDNVGNIVWQGLDPNGTDTDMFFYDRATGTITNVSNNDIDDYYFWSNSHGDFSWSSGYGAAAEIMFYSNATKAVTQITNDSTEDNYMVLNDQLDIAWVKFDGDYEIMLGKVQTTVPLDFTYSRATQDVNDGEIKIVINSEISLPAGTDQITVSLDGVTVLDVPFSDFIADDDPGEYKYRSALVAAELDINKGRFEIKVDGTLANTIDTSDGVYLEIGIGNAAGAGQIQITPINDGDDNHDGYHHQYNQH